MGPLLRLLLAVAVAACAVLAAGSADPAVVALAAAVVILLGLRLRDASQLGALRRRLEALEADRTGLPVVTVAERGLEAPGPEAPPASGPEPSGPRWRLPTVDWADAPEPARRAWAFVTGGNPFARVGLLVLFVGLGLAVREFASTGLQLGLVALVGAALVALGWRLRASSEAFGRTLQGGGVAVLYLTVYAAYALYGLVPSLAAIALMAVVAAACGGLALVQDAPALAVLGVAGGFAAPVLAGTAEGNHVLLLGYYALLNLGVLGVAWAKGWRSVAVVGFVSTFVTGGLWGGLRYRPELFATVQPFVVLSFGVYLALAVRFAVRSARHASPERALAVDGALVFGLPAATFVLQAGLVEGVVPFGRAWSAAALAVVYLVGAGLLRRRTGVALLADAFLAVGLAFATLALPLAFERVVFGAMWVLEGAGLVWVGARQRKAWMRLGGLLLQAAAATVLFGEGVLSPSSTFTAESLTGWIVAVGLGLSAFVLRSARAPDAGLEAPADGKTGLEAPKASLEAGADASWLARFSERTEGASWERTASRALLGFALFWWATTATVHVLDLAGERYVLAGLLGAAAASGALFLGLGRAVGWRGLAAASFGVVAAGWALWPIALASGAEPVSAWRGPAWLALFAVAALALWKERAHPLRRTTFVGAVWLAAAVLGWTVGWAVGQATEGAWAFGAVGAVLAASLAAASRLPAAVASRPERARSVGGLVVAVGLWLVASWTTAGASRPLPWLPVLNPVGLPTVAALLALAAVWRGAAGRGRRVLAGLVGAAGFGSLTAETLRAVSAYDGVLYSLERLYASSTAQAALAVAWTVLALVLAVVAVRRGSRPLWFFGAAVLGLVVAKLFLVDLSQAQAVVRIVAFVTVGALVLLVGYRAPLPPEPASPEAPGEGAST